MDRAIVLDAAGFFSGYVAMFSNQKIYTVGEVVDEIKDPRSRSIYENIVSADRISVIEPSPGSVRRVIEVAIQEGILEALSNADRKILALALDLREKGYDVLLITDDSYLHRLASKLGVSSKGARRGTPRSFKRVIYRCEVCGYRTRKRVETCPICGSRITVYR